MNKQVVTPPQTIGILGGGQLGRMIALKAREMGYGIVTLDPTPNSPCGQVADTQIVADFDDLDGARQLAQASAVVTYEFENVSLELAQYLDSHFYLPQGPRLLAITQNRIREKQAVERCGGAVAPYCKVENADQLVTSVDDLGYPVVLKTSTGGYDGKGQMVIDNKQELDTAKNLVTQNEREWIVEKYVPFIKELSVIVARNPNGEMSAFPVIENIHRDNILHISVIPGRVDDSIAKKARELAMTLASSLELVGLLAIEMFLLADGTLLVNEMAPRPHNSGHCTLQACHTNQFEQHIRAITNLPLGNTDVVTPTVMFNILGEHLEDILRILPKLDSSHKLHLYGKAHASPKRKMGHLNILGRSTEDALAKVRLLGLEGMEGLA